MADDGRKAGIKGIVEDVKGKAKAHDKQKKGERVVAVETALPTAASQTPPAPAPAPAPAPEPDPQQPAPDQDQSAGNGNGNANGHDHADGDHGNGNDGKEHGKAH